MTAPLIIGVGGTPRPNSSTERALALALRAVEAAGATTRLYGGEFIERLPHFNPGPGGPSPEPNTRNIEPWAIPEFGRPARE